VGDRTSLLSNRPLELIDGEIKSTPSIVDSDIPIDEGVALPLDRELELSAALRIRRIYFNRASCYAVHDFGPWLWRQRGYPLDWRFVF
jgi:hypothetical protein